MKKLLAFILMAFILLLTGCSNDVDIEGEWIMLGFYADSDDPEVTGALDDINELYTSGIAVQTTTYRDGKYTLATSAFGETTYLYGTYEIDGDHLITHTDDGINYHIVSIDGNVLTCEISDEKWEPSGLGNRHRKSE